MRFYSRSGVAQCTSRFDKAMTDDRIRYFLEKGKAKIRALKQKM